MDPRKEILFDGYFYDVSEFAKIHPGGGVINYYAKKGEDSSIAIKQLHKRSMAKVRLLMSSLEKRPASNSEIGLDATVLEKNRRLTEDFSKLYLEFERAGYFKPSYLHVFLRIAELFVFAGVGISLLDHPNILLRFIGLTLLIIARVRSGFLQHELGHYSCSGYPKLDRILHAVIYSLFIGNSAAFWKYQHNRHHAMPQRQHHDPDLETMPLLAYNAKVLNDAKYKYKSRFMIRYQVHLFVIDTLLVAILWLMYLNPKFMFKRRRYLELATMVVHFIVFYQIGFSTWFITTWITSFYFLVTLGFSHTFMPVTTEPNHWIEYSLLHTANVEPTPWCDWATGYLNYQIEHHMFPSMPNFRLPYIKDRVKALAEKHNIPYVVHSYPDAVWKVFKNMYDVGQGVDQLS